MILITRIRRSWKRNRKQLNNQDKKVGRSLKEDRKEYKDQNIQDDREVEIRQESNSGLGAQRGDTDSDKYNEDDDKIELGSKQNKSIYFGKG